MTRKLKATGLALVAVLVLGMTAGSASAAEFHSTVENTKLIGAQVGFNELTVSTGKVECEVVTVSGSIAGTTTTTEITLTPTYEECTLAGQAAVVHMNGCTFLQTSTGVIHIPCPAGEVIEITGKECTVTVPPQTPSGTADYKTGTGTNGKKDITITYTLTGLKYVEHGAKCKMNVSTVETSNGTLTGSMTDEGFNAGGGGAPVDIFFQ